MLTKNRAVALLRRKREVVAEALDFCRFHMGQGTWREHFVVDVQDILRTRDEFVRNELAELVVEASLDPGATPRTVIETACSRWSVMCMACLDCHADVYEIDEYDYMLRHEVWEESKGGRGFLCVGCLESRLGRELCRGDFDWSIPLNHDDLSWSESSRSWRLVSRMARK